MGVAASLAVLAFIPGFPTVTFLALAAGAFGLYKFSETNSKYIAHTAPAGGGVAHPGEPQPSQEAAQPQGPEAVMPLLHVDPIELEIGYGLTKLADARQGGDLPTRVAGVRRQLALELGFVMPSVRIRDNVQLAPNEYVIRIRGEEVARSEAFVDSCLAIDSGGVLNPVLGTQTKDPVFGIDALWIEKSQREAAERSGYTVIEPSAMISTHLSEVVKSHSGELLSRQDVQTLLDNVKELDSAVVEELVPTKMTVGEVQKVLQHLLRERIPIRDMVTVLETLADFADRIKDPDSLGELVRASISRTITRQHLDDSGKIYCITLDPGLERSLAEALQQTPYGSVLAIEPELSQAISRDVSSAAAKALADSKSAVVLCGNSTRLPLKRLLERHQVTTPVLAFNEISASADVEFVAQIQHAAIAA